MAKKKVPFEKSKYDVEKPGVKEGSKEDMALDRKQKKAAGYAKGGRVTASKDTIMGTGYAKGGRVCHGMAKGGGVESKGKTKGKHMAAGGIMRGTGAAVKGKKFTYNG